MSQFTLTKSRLAAAVVSTVSLGLAVGGLSYAAIDGSGHHQRLREHPDRGAAPGVEEAAVRDQGPQVRSRAGGELERGRGRRRRSGAPWSRRTLVLGPAWADGCRPAPQERRGARPDSSVPQGDHRGQKRAPGVTHTAPQGDTGLTGETGPVGPAGPNGSPNTKTWQFRAVTSDPGNLDWPFPDREGPATTIGNWTVRPTCAGDPNNGRDALDITLNGSSDNFMNIAPAPSWRVQDASPTDLPALVPRPRARDRRWLLRHPDHPGRRPGRQ